MEISDIVNRFKDQMLIELENNSRKGSVLDWKEFNDKIVDLEYHKSKLLFAIKEDNLFAIREYIADCANILLSIGYGFGLYSESIENPQKESIFVDNPIEIRDLGISKIKQINK